MPLMLGIINIIIAMILVSAKFRILKSNALSKKKKKKKVREVCRQLVINLRFVSLNCTSSPNTHIQVQVSTLFHSTESFSFGQNS